MSHYPIPHNTKTYLELASLDKTSEIQKKIGSVGSNESSATGGTSPRRLLAEPTRLRFVWVLRVAKATPSGQPIRA